MDKKELQEKLKANYNRNTWKEILLEMFPEADLFAQDDPRPFTKAEQRNLANHIVQFGEIELDGDTLIFLEVELKSDSVQLARNRVGLRKLVDNEVIGGLTDAALISYYQPETDEWRLSFYSERYGWDEEGNTIKEETHPKRYTYVVGPSESCKTAAERLIKVIDNRENILETVLEAFSVEKVSKHFFKEYKEQYDKFVGYLTGKNWTKSGVKVIGDRITQFHFYFKATTDHEKEARDFVKKLLGRIVFLYFVQKKQWMGATNEEFRDGVPDFIFHLFKQVPGDQKNQFYSQYLTKLFFDTLNRNKDHTFTMPDGNMVYIPFLNGGLFEKDETDKNTESLSLPGELFSNPEDTESPNIRGFLDFLSAYNFTIHEDSPGDHTIAVDPEMLGHIFENLLEDNKDKGAYYTPKPIVHYMCQESIIEYLFTSLGADQPSRDTKKDLRIALEDLVKNQNVGSLSGKTKEILKALHSVKVCDPAIGSGAFPMGILQEIFQIVDTFHLYESDEFYEGWNLKDGEWKPAEVKKQIIQNSIYGVDIEKGAVDIARLRFWLSLIVDEEEPTALPNLDYKIVVGDSLISKFEGEPLEIEWDLEDSQSNMFGHEELLKRQKLLKDITETQKQYFKAGSAKKEELALKVRNQKIDLLINQLSLTIQTKGEEKKPTGSGKKINERMNRWVDTQRWKQLIQTLKDLRENPKKPFQHFDWKLDFPEILNKQFTDDAGFDIVIANPPYGITVVDDYRTITEEKLGKVPDYEIYYLFIQLLKELANNETVCTYIIPNSILFNVYAEKYRSSLLDVFNFKEILDLTDLSVFDATVRNIIFILKRNISAEVGYRNPRDITDFKDLLNKDREYISVDELLEFSQNWALAFRLSPEVVEIVTKIKSDKNTISERFVDISQGLIAYDKRRGQSKEVIENRAYHFFEKKKDDLKPWLYGSDVNRYDLKWNGKEYIDYCDGIANPREPKFFKGNRILIREITNPRIYAAYTNKELYNDPSLLIIKDNEQKEIIDLLGIINSNLATFYHFNNSPKATKGAFPKVLIKDLKEFPLPEKFEKKILSKLVDQILTKKEANPEADTTALEQQIDTLVYKLYNLTWEEVQVVDPDFGLSELEYNNIEV